MALQPDAPWPAIAATALLGTERQPFQPPIAPGQLGDLLSHLGDRSSEAALLAVAGTLALHQRVGQCLTSRPSIGVAPCSEQDLPRCSGRATWCLQQVLQGQYASLLPEWLEKAAIAQHRVPELLLPALLDKGRQQRELRAALLPTLGQRGRWLAAQNPDWNYAVALVPETDWDTGTTAARVLLLQDLRSHAPDRARALLQATWSQEPASDRVRFLETFRVGLSLADEPFLTMALGDRRSKEVRRVAADLLAHLPTSRLCQQMSTVIQPYVVVSPGSPPCLTVELPTTLEGELSDLGIDPNPSDYPSWVLGKKSAWLMQMIGATSLTYWNDTWTMTPTALIHLALGHEWQPVLLQGWALAAQRQGDRAWSAALLQVVMDDRQPDRTETLPQARILALLNLLPLEQQNNWLLALMRSHPDSINQPWIIHLLCQRTGEWSLDLTETVFLELKTYTDVGKLAWNLRPSLKDFARFIPLSFLPKVVELHRQLPPDSVWLQSMDELLALLQFRQDLATAFAPTTEGR